MYFCLSFLCWFLFSSCLQVKLDVMTKTKAELWFFWPVNTTVISWHKVRVYEYLHLGLMTPHVNSVF